MLIVTAADAVALTVTGAVELIVIELPAGRMFVARVFASRVLALLAVIAALYSLVIAC